MNEKIELFDKIIEEQEQILVTASKSYRLHSENPNYDHARINEEFQKIQTCKLIIASTRLELAKLGLRVKRDRINE